VTQRGQFRASLDNWTQPAAAAPIAGTRAGPSIAATGVIRLAPEQTLEITHAQFQLAHTAGGDNIVIGLHRHLPTFGQATPPAEQKAWREAM
jgi:hypothetical protein